MGPLRHILTLFSALLIALISALAAPALPIPAFPGEIGGAKALSTCFVQAIRNDTQAGAPNKGNFEAVGEILGELQADIYLSLAVPSSMAAKYGAKLQKLAPNRGVCSFHADTLALTDGGLLPISDVNTNMSVWSRNPANGDVAWQAVQAQYSNPYEETVSVTMRDIETGAEQTIVSNRIHPYFVQTTRGVANSSEGHVYAGPLENGHWVDAAELQMGDRLLNDDGTWAEVVSVEIEAEPLTAFNLTVAEFHTYFVAANETAAPVWVHNDCWDALPSGATATGQTNSFGQATYRGPNGENLYVGHDGRFYDAAVHAPTPSYATRQLQHGFSRHAEDFGITGNWNNANGAAFRNALNDHIKAPGTTPITGTYRGEPVTHYYNPATGNNVFVRPDGSYWGGWRLSSDQVQNITTHGGLQ